MMEILFHLVEVLLYMFLLYLLAQAFVVLDIQFFTMVGVLVLNILCGGRFLSFNLTVFDGSLLVELFLFVLVLEGNR
jgi:hypothetical protein